MELRQLRYFVAVAEELHFGRAARRVHISQPPLSMQIRNLEEELGVVLFKRTSRRVELTGAGAVFLEDVRNVLANLEMAGQAARDAAKGRVGRIAVGFVGPAMDSFLPGMIRGFRTHHPGIKLALSQAGTNDQLEDLRKGRIQVGFVRIFRHELEAITAKIVWREPYVLALPRDHFLAARRRIGLKHLKGQPMIMYPRNIQPALFDAIMDQCERAGFTPVISQEAGFKHITTALVAAGLGVAIVPASSKALARKGVVFRPISDALPPVEIARVHRTGDPCPVLKRFLDFVG